MAEITQQATIQSQNAHPEEESKDVSANKDIIDKESEQIGDNKLSELDDDHDQNYHFYKEYCRLYYANIILSNRL